MIAETAVARGAIPECPELGVLEQAPLAPRVYGHVELCEGCLLVLELLSAAPADALAGADPADCMRLEPLLAAHADGSLGAAGRNLLSRHLASCEPCRLVALTGSPVDTDGDHSTLPEVDPRGYALGLEIGRGGMGRILAARDLRIGRPVAVKELLGRTRALATRFEREARITARLQHPGIVPIYEIGRWPDDTPFYSMRMVDGRTLRDAIGAALTLAARLALMPAVIAAAEAVAFAHAQRIIHRDLTPSNVLVGAFGETVVIDWGLAKDLADASDDDPYAGPYREGEHAEGLTGAGAVIGTAAYMPPEQAHAEPVDERADVYALGAVLYHVLAGTPPYRARRGEDLLSEVKAGPPAPIEEVAPRAPRDLVSIVGKAMARDPAARYPSARELAAELSRFQTGRMVEAHVYTTAERMRRFVARNRAALVVLAAGLVVVGAIGGVAISRVYRERGTATRTVTTLLEEKGRTELAGGHPMHALAYLAEAYARDDETPSLRFMLAMAMREVDSVEATLDCGDDVRAIDVSADGTRLVAACQDVAKIWRLGDHALVATLGPFPQGFDEIHFSHDGQSVVAGGLDGNARVFDAATGALRTRLEHAAGTRITWLGLTPDDRRLVTTGFDGTAQVWDVATGTRIYTLAAGQLGFVGVHGRLTPDGKTLVTATLGGTGTGWDVATGARLGSLDHGSQILGGEVSWDSKLACTPGVDRRVVVWDLAARTARWTLSGHSDAVWKCVFSPDDTRLATGGNDGTAKIWDLRTGALVTSVAAGGIVWSIAWSPDSQQIATTSVDGSLAVWEASTGAQLASHDDPFGGKAAMFTPDGTRLIAQRGDGRIRIWRTPGGPLRHELAPAAGETIAATSADGTRVVIARDWDALELWDAAGHARIAHEPITAPVAISGDGARVVARGAGGVVVLDARDGHVLARLPLAAPASLALDRAGDRVLARDADGALRVWDVAAGSPIGGALPAVAAVLSDDGRRALVVPDAAIWDVDRGRRRASLGAVGDDPRPLGFSRDGRRVAVHSTGDGGTRTLGVWTEDGELVFQERVGNDGALFDRDGRLLATVGPDHVVRVRRADDGAVLAQFVGERLARAQADPRGELVVAIDQLGTSALVLGAADGRVLAQHPLLHAALRTSEDTFVLPEAAAWWAGDAIVTQAHNVAVWDAHSETRSPRAITELARDHLPWRVRDGRLELTTARVRGVVTVDGEPAAGVAVAIAIREVPRLPAAVNWTTTMSRLYARTVTTDADGAYELGDLLPGEYALIARAPSRGLVSRLRSVHVSDLDADEPLELARGAAITGSVLAPDGHPLAGASVVATCSTQPLDAGSASTAADGSYTLAALAGECSYHVVATAGHATPPARARVEVADRTAHVIAPPLVAP